MISFSAYLSFSVKSLLLASFGLIRSGLVWYGVIAFHKMGHFGFLGRGVGVGGVSGDSEQPLCTAY